MEVTAIASLQLHSSRHVMSHNGGWPKLEAKLNVADILSFWCLDLARISLLLLSRYGRSMD